jgi:hypothetical protein
MSERRASASRKVKRTQHSGSSMLRISATHKNSVLRGISSNKVEVSLGLPATDNSLKVEATQERSGML